MESQSIENTKDLSSKYSLHSLCSLMIHIKYILEIHTLGTYCLGI